MKLKIKQTILIILSFLIILNLYKFIQNREKQNVFEFEKLKRSVDTILGIQQKNQGQNLEENNNGDIENKNVQLKKEPLDSNENGQIQDEALDLNGKENIGVQDEHGIENKDNDDDDEGDDYYSDNSEENKDDLKEDIINDGNKYKDDVADVPDNKEAGGDEQSAEIDDYDSETQTPSPTSQNEDQDKKEPEIDRTHYHGHDLLQDPKFNFDPSFKNPCWYGKDVKGERELKCLPYFYIIGVKKCGTSDLFYRITNHPDVIKPGFKEAQFFARSRFKGGYYDNINYYVDKFNPASKEIFNRTEVDVNGLRVNHVSITGEASPSNLHLNSHWMYLPGNENLEEPKYVHLDYIQHFLPDAKIIITFRDPIERLYSDYYHEYGSLMKNNNPNPQQFHDIVTDGIKLYQSCFAVRTVRSCAYDPALYAKTKIQIQLGIYYIFWEDLIRLYPRDRILVLQNKNLRDKETTLNQVFKHLDLRKVTKKEMQYIVSLEEKNTVEGHHFVRLPMFNKTVKMLRTFYRPYNIKFAAHLKDPDFLYE